MGRFTDFWRIGKLTNPPSNPLRTLLKSKISEQGLGDLQKSSTTPKEVTKMEGMKIPQVTMGLSHTLLLVNTDNEATQTKYDKMPEFDLED